MASRKEQKEQARAARLAREQELAAQTQRRRRLQLFGGVIAVAVAAVAVVVVIAVSSGGGSTSPSGTSTTQAKTQVSQLLAGIPQSGQTLGDPSAKVTLTYFGDLECPICDAFTLIELPTFIAKEVKPGSAKVVYRSYCTATCNNDSTGNPQQLFDTQQVAAYAAGMQNHFWDYAELFYHEQGKEDTGYVTESYLQGLAKQIPGLDFATWMADRKDPSLLDQVTSDGDLGTKYGIQGTPSFVLSGPKGSLLVPDTQTCAINGVNYGFPCASQLASDMAQVS